MWWSTQGKSGDSAVSADRENPCSYNGKTSSGSRKHNFEGRLTLSRYFAQLRNEDNYVSLKIQYQWNTEDDDFSTQVYSDEFVETGDFEAEMEEGETGLKQESCSRGRRYHIPGL